MASKYIAIDCETDNIEPITKSITKVWMIGWYYTPIGKEQPEYDYLTWPNGIHTDELHNLVANIETVASISRKNLQHDKLKFLRDVLSGNTLFKPVFHNAAFDAHKVLEQCGFEVDKYDDTMIAAYCFFPPATMGSMGDEDAMRFYSLAHLGKLGLCAIKKESPSFEQFSEEMVPYNMTDCLACYQLANFLLPNIKEDPQLSKAYSLDIKTQPITSYMEKVGTPIDVAEVDAISRDTTDVLHKVGQYIRSVCPAVAGTGKPKKYKTKQTNLVNVSGNGVYTHADIGKLVPCGNDDGYYLYHQVQEFNPASTPHKVKALKGLTGWQPTSYSKKTGSPTCDKHTLKELSEKYEFAEALLLFQKHNKLVTTYLPAFSKTDIASRIHPSFLLTATRTSRFASRNPNFQNIPKERCRKLIRASKGNVIVSIDLSQIELRILAYYAAVITHNFYLWGLYNKGADVHDSNMKLLETENRKLAKIAIFLRIYGGGPPKLAAQLDIGLQEATDKLQLMEERMPFISELANIVVNTAKRAPGNIINTLYGHRLCYPYIKSKDRELRAKAERQYFNGSIQGTQADVIKRMMCELWYVHDIVGRYGARILLQIHDELVFEVPESNYPLVMDILTSTAWNKEYLPGLMVEGTAGVGETWEESSADGDRRHQEKRKEIYGLA